MTRDEEETEERRDQFAQDGADLAGGLASVGVSVLASPALGVVAGVAVARLVRIGLDVWDRMWEPRQRQRASGAWLAGIGRAKQRLDQGEKPRDDAFLSPDEAGDSPAAELMEGVMIHASNAYQQRKVPHLGYLWSSVYLEPAVDVEYGHYLLNLADQLTWRQLVAIGFFGEEGRGDRVTSLAADREVAPTPFGENLGVELEQLGYMGLLGYWQTDNHVTRPARTFGGGGMLTDFEDTDGLMRAALMPTGRDLFSLMELDRISPAEKDRILELMKPDPS